MQTLASISKKTLSKFVKQKKLQKQGERIECVMQQVSYYLSAL